MENNDTSLIRMVITELAKTHNWDYEFAMNKFYNSNTCKLLSNESTGVFTFSPYDIVNMFEEELKDNKK